MSLLCLRKPHILLAQFKLNWLHRGARLDQVPLTALVWSATVTQIATVLGC